MNASTEKNSKRKRPEKSVEKIQKKALKPHAESILKDMKGVTPVSTVRNIHGIDAENIVRYSYDGYKGYKIGITNQGGHGGDYWTQIRGKHICHVTALIQRKPKFK